jgi:hypothetical protein
MVEADLVELDELLAFSSFDCINFLPSGILRRAQRVANAGTRARPIWILHTASSWLYSLLSFRAGLKHARMIIVTIEPLSVPCLMYRQHTEREFLGFGSVSGLTHP